MAETNGTKGALNDSLGIDRERTNEVSREFKGLDAVQVKESRELYGSNNIPDSKPTTFWQEFKGTFSDPMIKLLLFITVVMLAMYSAGYAELYEPVGIAVAIVIVAVVSAKTGVACDFKYRELKDSTEKIRNKVYRGGVIEEVNIDDIVVGDKVLLQPGDKVPADGLIISGQITVDNSALNGESEECIKEATKEVYDIPEEVTGDTFVDSSTLFRGSLVLDGEGVLEVKRVGLSTTSGKMALEMQESEPDSPLKVKLKKLAKQISLFGYIGAVVIAILYILKFIVSAGGLDIYFTSGTELIVKDILEALSLGAVIVVCAVPEGLPLMISIVLMQNTSKMLKLNVLVRKAIGIETAGALNILFSDKTGTITKGELEVVRLYTGKAEEISKEQLSSLSVYSKELSLAIGRNTSSMYDNEHNLVGGNATDRALLKFLGEVKYEALKSEPSYKEITSQAFNSSNKFSQSYIHILHRTYYKGAPEKLLQYATKALNADGEVVGIEKEQIEEQINSLAEGSMRVIALGYSDKKLIEDEIHNDLVIIGFVGIRDDVREEVKSAIAEVKGAGIQVVMITGDRLETARAIGKEAGLIESEDDLILTSKELGQLSDEELKERLPRVKIIARALPTDKSRVVRVCQELNLVTGMTGDGVNDAPALKRADVGFAMGSGTEVAKEAGDIVILDDNFTSIKAAVLYGRTIYHNILKFCSFQLTINIAAVVISALAPFFDIDEPLKVTHLLFVNLVMDGLGAIMLGNEPAKEEYMQEQPRRRDESLVSLDMFSEILSMGTCLVILSFYFLKSRVMGSLFNSEAEKLTAYFVLFIAMSLFNGFNVRDTSYKVFSGLTKNKGFLGVMLSVLIIQACIVNAAIIPLAPFQWVSNMFSCVPFGVAGWVAVYVLAFSTVLVNVVPKYILSLIDRGRYK